MAKVREILALSSEIPPEVREVIAKTRGIHRVELYFFIDENYHKE